MSEPLPDPPPPRAPRSVGRGRRIGSLVALALVIGVGALAWHLTHRPTASGSMPAAGGPDGPGGGPAGPGGAAGGRRGPPSAVAVAEVRRADVPVWIDALGTVSPVATVTVRPQVSGVLTQVLYREGQMVKKGETLAVIDPEPFRIALMQAEGARARDEAQLQNARLTLERYRTLLQQDSIARQDVDTQAALVRQLEGTLLADRAAEASARLSLSYTRIVSPLAGRAGLRVVDAGNYVAAGDAGGIAVITQIAPIDVEFALPQDRVPEIQQRLGEGAAPVVRALDRTRTRTLGEGRFSTLDNLIDTTTGTVKAKARFANADAALFPNQFVNVQLLLRTLAGALVVPVTAVRNGPEGPFVYVLNDDRTVSLRRVARGEQSSGDVVIASGLAAGERVVTEGADRLKDGAAVQLAADRAGAAASAPAGAASGGKRGRRERAAEGTPTGASRPAAAASRAPGP